MRKLMVAVVTFAGLVVSASAVLVRDMYNWADPRYFTTGCKFASVLEGGKASIGIWVKNITEYADGDNVAANMFGNLHGNVESQYASGGLMLSIRGGSFRFEVEGKASTGVWARRYLSLSADVSRALMTDGQWHFLLGTCDVAAQTARFFIDGQLVAENTELNLVTVPSGRCFAAGGIGMKTESTVKEERELYDAGYIGLFAEATIWNKALTVAQAADLSTRRALVWESGLVGYWPLAEDRTDCASSPVTREDGSVPHALFYFGMKVDDPDFFPVSPLKGPINVYRLGTDGTETYLDGYTLMSAAVAAAEEDVGSSYKILVMGDGSGTPAAYTEATENASNPTVADDGKRISCNKSYHFVGEGMPDHLDASTYPAILSNCVFEVAGSGCDYSFENLRLEGKSRIVPESDLESISVGNCYAKVNNDFSKDAYNDGYSCNSFIIAARRSVSTLTVTNNTLICKDPTTDGRAAERTISGVYPMEAVIANNVFGSEKADERCPYAVVYFQTVEENAHVYMTNNIAFFGRAVTSEYYNYPVLIDIDGVNVSAFSLTVNDNIAFAGEFPDIPLPYQEEVPGVGYFDIALAGDPGAASITSMGNYLNGSCYNFVEDGKWNPIESTYGHNVGGNIQAAPAGMVVLRDPHNGKCVNGTTLDAEHYCTNCCVLGYRVTLDANGGTWPGGVDPDAVTNQTFEALFRGQQLSPDPDHVVLGDEQMPWKNEKQAEGWKDGATGTVYTREQLVGSKVTDSKSYTAVYYKGLILFFGPAN